MDNFWDNHTVFFLILAVFLPRIALLCFTTPTFGVLAWLGWIVAPQTTIAVFAWTYYGNTNPFLVAISIIVALLKDFLGQEPASLLQNLTRLKRRQRPSIGTTQILVKYLT